MDYDTFANTRLRDVPFEVFEAYKDRLPELWRRRAEHYYSEFARTEKGAELWRKGLNDCMSTIKDAVRVVCLSEVYDSMLMWSHYAQNHRFGLTFILARR